MAVRVYDRDGREQSMEWLRNRYGNVRIMEGTGPRFRLLRIDETIGPATLVVRVLNEKGLGAATQPVANAWPNPELGGNVMRLTGSGLRRLYADAACVQRVGGDGYTGFGLGSGSWIRDLGAGGPHTVWVLSPSVDSDGVAGVGMLGGTDHAGPLSLTFQLFETDSPGGGGNEDPGTGPADGALASAVLVLASAMTDLARQVGRYVDWVAR